MKVASLIGLKCSQFILRLGRAVPGEHQSQRTKSGTWEMRDGQESLERLTPHIPSWTPPNQPPNGVDAGVLEVRYRYVETGMKVETDFTRLVR
jgi:hypothetical protein